MKKLLVILFALLPIMASAVITLGDVTISGNQYQVTVLMKKNKPYYYCIPCPSKEGGTHEIWLKPDKVAKFRTALFEAKAKFKEWKQVAQDNNVGEFEKEMPVKFPNVKYVWGHGDLFFCDAPFKLRYSRSKEGVDFAALAVHVVADTNRFVDENFVFMFYSESEFDSLLEVLSSKNIEKVMLENADYDTSTDKRTVDDNLLH